MSNPSEWADKPNTASQDFTADPALPALITLEENGAQSAKISLKYLDDGIEENCHEKIHLSMTCFKIIDKLNDKYEAITVQPCDIITKIKDISSACDDPHFVQKVRGTNEHGKNVSENICYELTGQAGDVFEILTDKKLGVSVQAQMRDDYYFGAARIETPEGVITATSTEISYLGHFKRSWVDVQRHTYGSDPTVIIELHKTLNVHIHGANGRKLGVKIERLVQGYGKSYLNVYVSETTNGRLLDKHHGGLFGFTANNKYQFVRPVQEMESAAHVKINSRPVKAFRKSNSLAGECFSLVLEDIIFPHPKEKFQKFF